MGQGAAGTLSWSVALRLGRISNLPTVWSNTLVGAVLVGGGSPDGRLFALLIAMSLFYVAGMYLNDAFDWPIDAQERPERPIPAGEVGLRVLAQQPLQPRIVIPQRWCRFLAPRTLAVEAERQSEEP